MSERDRSIMKLVEQITKLEGQLSSALAREKGLREALEKIARPTIGWDNVSAEIRTIARQALSGQPVEPKEVGREELMEIIFGEDYKRGKSTNEVIKYLLSHFDIRRKG